MNHWSVSIECLATEAYFGYRSVKKVSKTEARRKMPKIMKQ